MRHHSYNKEFQFVREPENFNKYTDREFLQYCLGGTLYMPGTKDIRDKVLNHQLDVTSFVMDMEDACAEEKLGEAADNILSTMDFFADKIEEGVLTIDDIPLIFVRVRNVNQFKDFVSKMTSRQAHVLTGFNFPKFCSENALEYLYTLDATSKRLGELLYGMPILEGKEVAYREGRARELLLIYNILRPYRNMILNVRVGGTDMSSIFGVRRDINTSIYDIITVRDALSDILNLFIRNGEYVVSGAVWEYFLAYKEDDINDLIKQNFYHSLLKGKAIVNEAIDGLLHEVVLDKANGFVGKTIIHPSHVRFVNAMFSVVEEEYLDAKQILDTSGGVIKSKAGNKMNEINPHRNWANKIMNRARAYGVVKSENSILEIVLGKTEV